MADDANPFVQLTRRVGVPVRPPDEPAFVRRPMRWSELEAAGNPPVRNWRINHWLTTGPTLFAGAGGIGKTLVAQTMATALALGRRYIEHVDGSARVLFWACEDDHDELWRRQVAICRFFGATLSDLEDRLIIETRIGMENCLYGMSYGTPQWTPLRKELIAQVNDYRADLLILDNIGQTFGCVENDRHHVTTFVNGLLGLVSGREFSPILLGHPAKQAGSEFSGSTAWENAVRMRWYLGMHLPDQGKDDPGEPEDPNVRFLAKRKANYTPRDFCRLIWRDGVFATESGPGEITQRYTFAQQQDLADDAVIDGMRRLAEIGLHCSRKSSSPDYLPKLFQAQGIAKAFTPKELVNAMHRLLGNRRIAEQEIGKKQNRQALVRLVIL